MIAIFTIPRIIHYVFVSVIQFYCFMIFAWTVLSWFDHSTGFLHDLYDILDKFVSPYVSIFKRFIPLVGAIDFSPWVAVIVLQLLSRLL